ncbi:helix-turn-helix domain-containing protein [Streptomyces flaveus]|nr:helix-turn-helix domain-containing protein [Streptomyces flaveus]
MTTGVAASELGISVNTLKKLIAAGLLPEVHERGNRTLLPAGDVRVLAQRETVDLESLGCEELAVLRVGPAEPVTDDTERMWIGYGARLTTKEKYEALRGWWRCDPERVKRAGVLAVTVGSYVVAVLTDFHGSEPGDGGRYRFSAQLAGYTTDLVTPVQVVRDEVPGAAEARHLLGRRLDSESGGPVAYVGR